MHTNEPGSPSEDYGFEYYPSPPPCEPADHVSLTITPVYAHEAVGYLEDLLGGRSAPATPAPPRRSAAETEPEPAEPISLRDELRKMGLL